MVLGKVLHRSFLDNSIHVFLASAEVVEWIMPDLFSIRSFSYTTDLPSRTDFLTMNFSILASFDIWTDQEPPKSSSAGSILLTNLSLSSHILLETVRRNYNTMLRNLFRQISSFITYKFYFPHNNKTAKFSTTINKDHLLFSFQQHAYHFLLRGHQKWL